LDFFWLETAFEVIDMRSFSNLWFWIALAALWSTASHYSMGVPFDMVRRAAKGDAQALEDMWILGNIQARRLLFIADNTGTLSLAFAGFATTSLTLLGWRYDVEFAQAILLLFLPMTVVFWLSVRTARRAQGLDAPDLGNLLAAHRRAVQGVGVVSIFLTSMWGMWVNTSQSVLS
jgi:hypothetical protein